MQLCSCLDTLRPMTWIPISYCCIWTLACIPNQLCTMNVPRWWGDISPQISLELITRLLEREGNWLIMFALSRYVTGIAAPHSDASQLARGITNANLTLWYGTLIVRVPGHVGRQDTATFMVRLALMMLHRSSCSALERANQTAARCNLGNLGHP